MSAYPCCDRDESYDDMVECGRCKKWYHYSCVGVNQSVAELAWFCRKCLGEDLSARESLGKPGATRIQPSRTAKKAGSSKTGQSVEQKKTYKTSEGHRGTETSQAKVGGNSAKAPSKRSVCSQVTNGSMSNLSSQKSRVSSHKRGSIQSTSSKRDLALKRIEELTEKGRLETLAEENELKILELKQKQIKRQQQEMAELLELSKVVEEESVVNDERDNNVDFRERIDEWMSQCDNDHPGRSLFSTKAEEREKRTHLQRISSNMMPIPSKLQIASRQVFPKNLPIFSGRPEDWPLFISAYEQANLSCGFSNAENLVRLQEALKGKALDVVRNRLLLPDNVPTIIEKLRRRFGNPEVLSTMLANRIQKLEGPDSENLESVIEFGSAIEEFTQHLEVSKLTDHLKNPILMQSLVQKLPSCYAMQWVEYKRRSKVVDLKTFGMFMEELVDKALEATFEKIDLSSSKKGEKSRVKGFIYATEDDYRSCSCKFDQQNRKDPEDTSKIVFEKRTPTSQSQFQKKVLNCSICQRPGHIGRECREFRNKSLEDRWRIVKRRELCPLCLYNHGNLQCRSKIRCDDEDCNGQHHPLLHPALNEGTSRMEARCNSHRLPNRTVMFRIVPVTLYHDGEEVDTLALVDEGSSISLLDNEVAKLLRVDGPCEPLKMCWTNGVSRTETNSRKVDVMISGSNKSKQFDLRAVRTVTKLDLPAQQLDATKLVNEFQHLTDIEIPSYDFGTPGVLIGIDNIHLIAPLDSRVGETGEPIAVKCSLGWTIYGPRPSFITSVHFLGHHHCICEEHNRSDQELNQMLRDSFQLETVGVSPIRLESKEEQRAREIVELTTKRVGRRFETCLPWKEGRPRFPDSYQMALKRLKNLEVRMNRNPGVRDILQKQIEEYIAKGYAHKVTDRELLDTSAEQIWYLPLNFVINPKKPGKIRMVWDAAAKSHGVSLNDKLLTGPDLGASLCTVLNSFRERRVAFGGDIKEMFHQILVRQEDQQVLRFLFRSNSSCDPDIYVMNVLIFGASCSPYLAHFVKNLNAREHFDQYPAAADAIIKKHYVDDYFDSADTVEEALIRAMEVRKVHAGGGFEIRNWVSNSSMVVEGLGGTEAKVVKSLDSISSRLASVLGILWHTEDDSFVFSTDLKEDLRPYVQEGAWPTKRIALRCVMSMFDPKQFLAPLLIHGRVLMQDLWRSGIGWDDKINEVHYQRWLRWTELFPLINNMRVPRCYLGKIGHNAYETVQLHVFTDAGDDSYGSVAYFRFTDGERIHCAFVEAKAKVVPLQYLSIPRKELEAAMQGARLLKAICENHSFTVNKRFLWTDSNAVVSWVKSDARRYKPFVAHRIGEILSITDPDNWRWVPTKQNAADDVTKWGKATQIKSDSRWFCGPDFLYQPEECWPEQKQRPVEVGEELRASILFHTIVLPDAGVGRIEHISKWNVLVRTVASMYRFISNCRRKVQKQPIEALPALKEIVVQTPVVIVPLRQREYLAAEHYLWRVAQGEEFADEVITLMKNEELPPNQKKMIEKSSPLYRLSPFLDEFGVVRMEGRTEAAEYAAFDMRFPIILPKNHLITRKLLEAYHKECGHGSRETVVNEVRQRFYVPRLRSTIDKIRRDCLWCKVQKTKPLVPRMASLPRPRMAVRSHPFSFVGLDYFGPLEVTIGRRREKRWVALFTCLTVRAVHLEVVHSLTTKSCEMAIRRFVKRYGSPIEIFSDNGTNFIGASRDLLEQIRKINTDCSDTFTGARTKWTFNPPLAPHMGGVWERMVRSVKEAMTTFTGGVRLTDEILQTALVEAESLINARPLTYVSTNIQEDKEALTPNHFLRSYPVGDCMPCRNSVELADKLRDSYRYAQHMADEMWSRWQQEYLPTMNRRTKWFEEQKPVRIGDLVYVADGEKRNAWERGIIEEVSAGADGRVRSAVVRTSSGVKRRPISKLAVMELGI